MGRKVQIVPLLVGLSVLIVASFIFLGYHYSQTTGRLQGSSLTSETKAGGTIGPIVPPGAMPIESPAAFDPIPRQGTPITGDAAMNYVKSGLSNITGEFAKATTWGIYFANSNPGVQLPTGSNLTSSRSVVVAAAAGNFNCDCSAIPLPPFSWKVVAFDQATGAMLNYWYGRGPLPAWYVQLPNAS